MKCPTTNVIKKKLIRNKFIKGKRLTTLCKDVFIATAHAVCSFLYEQHCITALKYAIKNKKNDNYIIISSTLKICQHYDLQKLFIFYFSVRHDHVLLHTT